MRETGHHARSRRSSSIARPRRAGVPRRALMERAGRAVARAAVDLCGGVYGRRAVVVCGKGNNGGDGLVAARRSRAMGHAGRGGPDGAARRAARAAADEPRSPAPRSVCGRSPFGPRSMARELARADVAVDAVFGTGFRGVPEDEWAEAIEILNAAGCPWSPSTSRPGSTGDRCGRRRGRPRRAHRHVRRREDRRIVLLPGAERAGAVRVVDIGFPDDLVPTTSALVEPADVAAVLPRARRDAHKRASGVVVVVAGSRGMTGAPALIAARRDARRSRATSSWPCPRRSCP